MDNHEHISVIGEALIDIVVPADGSVSTEVPGGSPANVALGLARLGRPVELETRIGNDSHGDALRAHLVGSGVGLTATSAMAGRTSTAVAHLDAIGQATYDFDLRWDLGDRLDLGPAAGIVHTGSIGAVWPSTAGTVLRAIVDARSHALITYDPNMRPSVLGPVNEVRPRVEALVRASDVVKVSSEDLEWLADGGDPKDLLTSWLRMGPALIVLTRGADGVVARVASGLGLALDAPDVEVVDTVGAGDSFMAGIIDALWEFGFRGPEGRIALAHIDEGTLAAILRHGSDVSGVTLTRRGADLPTRDDVPEPSRWAAAH